MSKNPREWERENLFLSHVWENCKRKKNSGHKSIFWDCQKSNLISATFLLFFLFIFRGDTFISRVGFRFHFLNMTSTYMRVWPSSIKINQIENIKFSIFVNTFIMWPQSTAAFIAVDNFFCFDFKQVTIRASINIRIRKRAAVYRTYVITFKPEIKSSTHTGEGNKWIFLLFTEKKHKPESGSRINSGYQKTSLWTTRKKNKNITKILSRLSDTFFYLFINDMFYWVKNENAPRECALLLSRS